MIRNLSITLEVDDQDLDGNLPFDVWLFQFLNRLGYNHKVVSFNLDGTDKEISHPNELKEMHSEIKELSLTDEEK